MKPALLYLRKYIEENYQNNRPSRQSQKENNGRSANKSSEEFIFKEKKAYQCENIKAKEFYFKPAKSFNAIRLKQKLLSQTNKTNSQRRDSTAQNSSDSTFRALNEKDPKKIKRTIVSSCIETPKQLTIKKEDSNSNPDLVNQKGVRFNITSSGGNTPQFGVSPADMQSGTESPKDSPQQAQYQQQINQQKEMDLIIAQTFGQETPQFIGKSQHFKQSSKSMKKLGYNTLFDYLNEMKKYQNIKKKVIKQAHYYPLACMTPQIDQTQQYQLMAKKQKAIFQEKLQKFKKQVTIHQNFSSKSIELKNFNNSKSQNKPKSNFCKPQSPNFKKQTIKETIQKKSKKFLLEYQQIVICNCANKKYFSFKLSSNTDYNSFFKYTTPLLDSQPQKQNNYLIGNKEGDSLGLYFCCLINSSLGVRQGFFWIGKPLQYYRKDKVIKIIDDFLYDVDTFSMFETDRLWIVDYHGRNSHILKSLLIKCNETKVSQPMDTSTNKSKSRISKRVSLSVTHQPNTQTPEMYMSLLANFSQFNETKFVKKDRNNISTRGAFKLMYDPTETMG